MIKDIKSFGNKLTLPIASALRKRFESTFYQITSAFVDTTRKTPLGVNDWSTHLDDDGRLMNPKDLWVIVFNWGIEPQLRHYVWKHLLNVFPPDLTQTEREKFLAMKCKVRKCCKFLWYLGGGGRIFTFLHLAIQKFPGVLENASLVEKRRSIVKNQIPQRHGVEGCHPYR